MGGILILDFGFRIFDWMPDENNPQSKIQNLLTPTLSNIHNLKKKQD